MLTDTKRNQIFQLIQKAYQADQVLRDRIEEYCLREFIQSQLRGER